jgi:hypothetical protein
MVTLTGGCCFDLRYCTPDPDHPYGYVETILYPNSSRLTSVQVYTYLVTNFGNVAELGNLVWSFKRFASGAFH